MNQVEFIQLYINQIFIEHFLCVPGVGDAEVNICSSNGTGPLANRKMKRFRTIKTNKHFGYCEGNCWKVGRHEFEWSKKALTLGGDIELR